MGIDLFGNDSAVNQQNNLNAENVALRNEAQDWNNKIQTQYNQDKAGENLTDDATYSKDLVGNVMGSFGLNQAYKGRQERLIQDAKNRLKEIIPSDEVNVKAPNPDNFGGLDLGFMRDPSSAPPRYESFSIDGNAPSIQLSGGTDDAGVGDPIGTLQPTSEPAPQPEPQPDDTPPADDTAGTGSTEPAPNVEGEPRPSYINGGTAEEESELKKTIAAGGEDEDTLLGMGLSKVSGGYLGEGAAKTIGRVGGAAVSGSVAGIDLVEGINNLRNHQDFFGKDHDWEDVVSKTSQMIAGASDVAGLIPAVGPEIAAIGNVIGLVGGVVGMFGDHKKNLQNDQNVEDELNQKKILPSARAGDQVGAVSQSTLQEQTA